MEKCMALNRRPEEWITPNWPAPPNVQAFVTTRDGGVSTGSYAGMNLGDHVGDDPQSVATNRARLRTFLPGEPVWLKQIHGTRVIRADEENDSLEADAAITTTPGVVLAIQTADCLPVLLCDREGAVVGAAHAGWRGLCSGIIENTIAAMNKPSNALLAYLGPAIGPNRFEVGPEVRAQFIDHDANAAMFFKESESGKWLADLYGLAKQRLHVLGVAQVYGGDFCTVTEKDRFYSYRRDHDTGRMATVIWLK